MSTPRPRDWDAPTYHRVSEPMLRLGLEVLARLELRGDETVLDAGCGTGRVTLALLERLPRGRVVAVDAAPSMVARAREELPADRADVRCQDLAELTVEEPVDAILSTATFHWVPDHDRLVARLHAALRPGGRLEAQCGGAGNVASLHCGAESVQAEEPYARHFSGWDGPWNFQSAEATCERLERAGFAEVACWLEPREVQPDDALGFIESICLGSHVEQLPEELRRPFAEEVLRRLPEPLRIDYVRLNISARRPD